MVVHFISLPLTSTCFTVQVSKLTDLTKLICTPKFRWIPEQSMHMNTPRLAEAHRGPTYRHEIYIF